MEEKVRYFTQYNHPKTKPFKCNRRFITRELEFIDENGKPYLETVETINMWEKTQSHKEECLIENILKQAALGDLSAFQQREATYADVTGLPKTLAEYQNIVIRMKDEFNRMPNEVKQMFDYSPEKYVNMMGTKEFNDLMAPYNKKINDIKAAGSLKEYQKKVAEQAKFNADVKAAEGSINNEQGN